MGTTTTATTIAVAPSALPAAFALSSLSSSSSSSTNFPAGNNNLSLFSSLPKSLGLSRSSVSPLLAVHMDTLGSDEGPISDSFQEDAALPELLTEFMVDMKCEGCVTAVKDKLHTINGVKNVEADLGNQVVRILGTSPVKTLTEALDQTGRKARLIGQGVPEDFVVSAAVAEFKGPQIFGVARLAQVSMELARIEASFSGLCPGKHGWSINEYGDLTRGAASTGKVYNTTSEGTDTEPLGDLGTLDVDSNGNAYYSSVKKRLRVADLIGRAMVVYETKDKSDSGLTAAVIARSAGVGENYKKICTCDGTTIWEANDRDFVKSQV